VTINVYSSSVRSFFFDALPVEEDFASIDIFEAPNNQ
jgi:hypothetical protein